VRGGRTRSRRVAPARKQGSPARATIADDHGAGNDQQAGPQAKPAFEVGGTSIDVDSVARHFQRDGDVTAAVTGLEPGDASTHVDMTSVRRLRGQPCGHAVATPGLL